MTSVAATNQAPDLAACECDNTHDQNNSVCRWCWDRGRRKPTDADAAARLAAHPNAAQAEARILADLEGV